MRRHLLPLLFCLPLAARAVAPADLREGDILFQTSRSRQSIAIQRATHSRWSHMGVVVKVKGEWWVFEAAQPVKLTPLTAWIARGAGGVYEIRRLRDADTVFTPSARARLMAVGRPWLGRDYDPGFEWSDRRLYCSELVWKLYQRALGIELSPLAKLRDADLSDPVVAKLMRERHGAHPPLDAPVISPQQIYDSPKLVAILPVR